MEQNNWFPPSLPLSQGTSPSHFLSFNFIFILLHIQVRVSRQLNGRVFNLNLKFKVKEGEKKFYIEQILQL